MKQLLTLQDCLDCKDCCYYYINYRDLAPAFDKTTKADKKRLVDKKTHFIARCSKKKNDDYFFCDFKQGDRCELEEQRPFACKLYPFNVMKDKNGNVVIGIDWNCKGVKKKTKEEIDIYIKKLKPFLKKELENRPFLVENFQKEIKIIEYL